MYFVLFSFSSFFYFSKVKSQYRDKLQEQASLFVGSAASLSNSAQISFFFEPVTKTNCCKWINE